MLFVALTLLGARPSSGIKKCGEIGCEKAASYGVEDSKVFPIPYPWCAAPRERRALENQEQV